MIILDTLWLEGFTHQKSCVLTNLFFYQNNKNFLLQGLCGKIKRFNIGKYLHSLYSKLFWVIILSIKIM